MFAAVTLLAGIVYLAVFVNWLAAALGAADLGCCTCCVYTPLKTRSADEHGRRRVAGALPVLIGWTATGAALDRRAVALVLRAVPLAIPALHGDRLALSRRVRPGRLSRC